MESIPRAKISISPSIFSSDFSDGDCGIQFLQDHQFVAGVLKGIASAEDGIGIIASIGKFKVWLPESFQDKLVKLTGKKTIASFMYGKYSAGRCRL